MDLGLKGKSVVYDPGNKGISFASMGQTFLKGGQVCHLFP